VRGSILDHLSPYLAMGLADRELTLDQLPQAYAQAASGRTFSPRPADSDAPTSNATDRVVQVLQSIQERRRGQ
jgi:hypothetical protein